LEKYGTRYKETVWIELALQTNNVLKMKASNHQIHTKLNPSLQAEFKQIIRIASSGFVKTTLGLSNTESSEYYLRFLMGSARFTNTEFENLNIGTFSKALYFVISEILEASAKVMKEMDINEVNAEIYFTVIKNILPELVEFNESELRKAGEEDLCGLDAKSFQRIAPFFHSFQ